MATDNVLNSRRTSAVGAGDDEILITSGDVQGMREHVIVCTEGKVDVETVRNGENPNDPNSFIWSDSATQPVAMLLQSATDPALMYVTELLAGQTGIIQGRLDRYRVKQKGAVASRCHTASYL